MHSRPERRIGPVLAALAAGWLGANHLAPVFAAAPTLEHVFPVAVQAGTTTAVTAVGKFAPWPPQVWVDAPGILFRAGSETGKFSVDVSPDVPAGPHLIRFHNDTGASAPRFLLVAAEPQGAEAEPNDDPARATLIARVPATINGRLGKGGDVDSFAVELAAGQTLIASLEAYVLGSPVDAVLRLVDARGLEVALNHDDGRTLDPLLRWTAPAAGRYVLQVFGFALPATSDVKFTGSDACVYRLHLADGRGVRPTLPPLPQGGGPEWGEAEFRSRAADMPAPASPFAITGCIETIGEEDRYPFAAEKDEKLVLEIQSAAVGFPLDAWLAIQDAGGKELVRNDDGASADPLLEWTAPKTGSYVAVVGNVLHRAGADHVYRLTVQRARPRFQGVIAESGFTIEPGKTITIKVTARRIQGFKSRLQASIAGLPPGLVADPVELGEKEKEISLKLTAAADAAPFSGPVQVQFRDEQTAAVVPAVHELVATSLKNGVPQGFRELVIRSTDQIWLTVGATPPAKTAKAAK